MPKKSERQRVHEDRLIAWYKWEFLRRNAVYAKDYEEFIREFGGWFRKHGYWYDQTRRYSKEAFRFFAEVIAPRAKTICERWQLTDPFSPKWNFDQESGSRPFKRCWEISLPTVCSSSEAGQEWDLSDFLLSEDEFRKILVKSTKPQRGPRPDHELTLAVDLRKPLDRLLREVRDKIKTRKAVYDRLHPAVPELAQRARRRLDLYDVYLRVWDLRAGHQTFAAIGKLVFPDQVTAAQRAIDSYQRAKELIEGGYKELR
jgi:hypothetical protein